MTLAKSTLRQQTKSRAPAASGKSGIVVAQIQESRTIAMQGERAIIDEQPHQHP
jgi:hypothetical protein